jgi:hypothetical protein
MELDRHAMPHTQQITLRSALDQRDRSDVVDGLNEELVLVLSESRRGDKEIHHDVSSRVSDCLHRAPETVSLVSVDAGSPLMVFSRVVQDHFIRLQYLCAALSLFARTRKSGLIMESAVMSVIKSLDKPLYRGKIPCTVYFSSEFSQSVGI